MQRLHLIMGLIGIAAFLTSGLYMHFGHNHLRGLDDTTRLLFRSTHIYLLLASLVNLALGMYVAQPVAGWRCWIRRTGSVLVLAEPVLFALGFAVEPWLTGLDRPYTRPAVIGTFTGMMLHLVSCCRSGPN